MIKSADVPGARSAPGATVSARRAAAAVAVAGDTAATSRVETERAPNSGASSPLDHIRVAALKEALQSGRYRIDAGTVANRLIELERDLP